MKYEWDGLDPDDLVRLRDSRLRKQVRFQLYAYSPFYRKTLDELGIRADGFRGMNDLVKLPIVDREKLASSGEKFLLTPTTPLIQRWGSSRHLVRGALDRLLRGLPYAAREVANDYQPVHVLQTSGTSGEPIPIVLSRRDLAVLSTQGTRMLEVAGVEPHDVMLNLLEPISSGGFWPAWAGGVAMGLSQIAPGSLEADEAAALARRMNATVLVARADDAAAILDLAGDDDLAVRLLILAPQALSTSLRRRLTEGAGDTARIVSTYGFAEGRALWSECVEGSGYPDAGFHLSADFDLVEILSARTGEPAGPGEHGEIAFTGLEQRGTALARYRPGDFAHGGLVPGRCPYCGRIADRIVGPITRTENLVEIHMEGGAPLALDVETLAEVLAQPNLSSWQVEITKPDGDPSAPDEVYVLFNPKKNRDPARVAVELDRVFRTEVGFSPTQIILSDRAAGGVVDLRMVPVSTGAIESRRVRLWRMPAGNGQS